MLDAVRATPVDQDVSNRYSLHIPAGSIGKLSSTPTRKPGIRRRPGAGPRQDPESWSIDPRSGQFTGMNRAARSSPGRVP